MGCDCCKYDNTQRYVTCQELDEQCKKRHIVMDAPCGGTQIGYTDRGSNYTPPKRKSKKLKKKKH